jgi:hypothetical protein
VSVPLTIEFFTYRKIHLPILLYPDCHSTSCQFRDKNFWNTDKRGEFRGNTRVSRTLSLNLYEGGHPLFFKLFHFISLLYYKSSYLPCAKYPWKLFEGNGKEMGVTASGASCTPTWVSPRISWEINPKCSVSKFSAISRIPLPYRPSVYSVATAFYIWRIAKHAKKLRNAWVKFCKTLVENEGIVIVIENCYKDLLILKIPLQTWILYHYKLFTKLPLPTQRSNSLCRGWKTN